MMQLAKMSEQELNSKVLCLAGDNNDDMIVMLKVEKRPIEGGKTILKFRKALTDIMEIHNCCQKDVHRPIAKRTGLHSYE